MTQDLTVCVRGIGLLGPGLPDWAGGQAALRATDAWASAPAVVPAPQRLPAAERRRAGAIVKLSLAVADQALAAAGADPVGLATVFSASSGDPANCHALCEVLASRERLVSPTRFTNSVHNASAGYWHVATRSRAPSTSLCAYDASFGAGLLEAAVQCVSHQQPVLLVACDVPYVEPLHGVRPIADAFGLALLLDVCRPDEPAAAPRLQLALRGRDAGGDAALSACAPAALDQLRRSVPAARGLPLLQALAQGGPAEVLLDYLDTLALSVRVDPGAGAPA